MNIQETQVMTFLQFAIGGAMYYFAIKLTTIDLSCGCSDLVKQLTHMGFTRETAELYIRGWRPSLDPNFDGVYTWNNPTHPIFPSFMLPRFCNRSK
jgi:hypothetical protein